MFLMKGKVRRFLVIHVKDGRLIARLRFFMQYVMKFSSSERKILYLLLAIVSVTKSVRGATWANHPIYKKRQANRKMLDEN